MELYNKIMLKVWLGLAVVSFILTTVMIFVESYQEWVFYYTISGIALFMFIMKRWMMKRMAKHAEYLNDKNGK